MTKCTPTCDAEKAVLVEALKDARMLCQNTPEGRKETSQVFEAVQVIDAVLANTSPAALLARGERFRREVAWLETACAHEDKSFDMFDVLERFRAALSGEEKAGDPHSRCPPRAPCGQYSAEEATEPCVGMESPSGD